MAPCYDNDLNDIAAVQSCITVLRAPPRTLWRRRHRVRGRTPPTFTNGWARNRSRKTANNKLTKLY